MAKLNKAELGLSWTPRPVFENLHEEVVSQRK